MSKFKFEFSLEILNLLGRGLYRNFAAVVAEAISNSWDAEATEVRITINKDEKVMEILDNGKGMDTKDFQSKFLTVGYTRRDDINNTSARTVLGRKGIGKLAMLSISKKISLVSKKINQDPIGGEIDNSELDQKIEKKGKYNLSQLPEEIKNKIEYPSGTYIRFIGIKETVNNPELIKKYLAVLFNFSFSFSEEKFDIYVNNDMISVDELKALNDNTQFLWSIDINKKDKMKMSNRFSKIEQQKSIPSHSFMVNDKEHEIKGYIASVKKPNNLKIHGTAGEFKAGLHLFVNGRLRQEDIFKDISSQRIVESYLYGEIHVDSFDDGEDIFTSSREGIIKDSSEYIIFLAELKKMQSIILNDWDKWREKRPIKKLDDGFNDLKPAKRNAIRKFLKHKEDDDLKEVFTQELMEEIIPEPTDKKVLICHASQDKSLADKVYNSLINDYGFSSKDIIYTSSTNPESKLPVDVDIFEYLRKFFVQEWRDNPHVIFILSKKMEESWHASLEAGASWVTQTEHSLFVAKEHRPHGPFNPDNHIYINFDEHGEYSDIQYAKGIFDGIKKKYQS